jgi:hypothetical protein
MSELPPDIPPWSPLVGREPGQIATIGEPDATAPAPEPDGPGSESPGTAHRAGRWVVIVAVLAVLAASAVAVAVGRDAADLSPPPTTVRQPVPATTWEEPAPLGTMVALGNGWTITVQEASVRANAGVRPLNADRPLEAGQTYVLMRVELYYLDGPSDQDAPFYGVDLGVMGEDGRLITPADSPCTAPKPELNLESEVAQGSSALGHLCFAVDATQSDSLRLVAEPSMSFGARPSYLALTEPPAPKEGS